MLAVVTSLIHADNLVRPGQVWPDTDGVHINAHGGGILAYEGSYYWFGEHKVSGPAGNRAQVGVRVYSSKDLGSWKNEGVALAVSNDPGSDIAADSIIERPKVIYNPRTKKFVLWFHLELKGMGYKSARAGVATADKVTGPFVFQSSFRPNAGLWPQNYTGKELDGAVEYLVRDMPGGQMSRDMTLYVDDDGKAYHITSSEENHTLHISLLTDDFLKPSGKYVRALPMGDNEAVAIWKRAGKYYMIASGITGWRPNAAKTFVSEHIFGPWQPLGNPVRGTAAQIDTTFGGQSTFVLALSGQFVFMGDIWHPKDPIDGRYLWLPIEWENDKPILQWRDSWSVQ
jgi:beta-xylosidase